jgi:hypothetical protein
MIKKILDIRHFIILFLLIVCFLLQHNKPKKEIVIQKVPSEPELIHDTIIEEVIVYEQGETILKLKDTTIYVTTIEKVDTSAILRDFLVYNTSIDTLKLLNNQGFVYLFDSISQNNIISRKWSANIKPKIVREPSTEPPKIRNQVYIGMNGTWNEKDWVNSVGSSILLKTKDDKIFQIGVGVINRTLDGYSGQFTPYLNGGVYWKIKIKKD